MPKMPKRHWKWVNALSTKQLKGLAIILDTHGYIKEIRHNTIDGFMFEHNTNIINYLEKSSMERFLGFLKETLDQQYSFGGEVAFIYDDTLIKVSLVMMQFGENIICMSLNEDEHTVNILNEVIRINIEQNNQLRKAYAFSAQGIPRDLSIEKMTLLNSELVNTQRELAQKNIELERLNAKLKNIGEQDYLTKVPNRRKFFDDVRNITFDVSYMLIMIDFNNFKMVNDKFGHDKGDETLIEFTKLVTNKINEHGGQIYRFGGDEFVILVQLHESFNIDDCMKTLNDHLRTIHPKLSIAYGVVTITRSEEIPVVDIETALQEVDKLMYRNKYSTKKT